MLIRVNKLFKVTASILAVAFFLSSNQAVAQSSYHSTGYYEGENPKGPFDFEARLSISGFPDVACNYYNDGTFFDDSDGWNFSNRSDVSSMYKDYRGNVYSTGTVSVEFGFILKKWLTVSFDLGINHFWSDVYDGVSEKFKKHDCSNVIYIMPDFKFTYFHHPTVKLYSGFGIGAGFYDNFYQMEHKSKTEFQITPIGVMVGRTYFGFAELGFGSVFCGGKIGFGYRF
jgi:hypothetical protein